MNGISRETFNDYDTNSKLNTLFDYAQATHTMVEEHMRSLTARVEALERKKKFDTSLSTFMGLVGGMIAGLGKKLFGG